MKIAVITVAVVLSGCAVTSAPRDVEIMPTDCVNRVQIINWLNYQLQQPKALLQNSHDYEQQQAKIKYRLWTMRYHCQPV